MDPFWDHFGADTSRIYRNFGFRKQIALVNAPNRFRDRSGCLFRLCICIARFAKLPHNQHPAGSHSKVVLGCLRKLKKQAGRKHDKSISPCECGHEARPTKELPKAYMTDISLPGYSERKRSPPSLLTVAKIAYRSSPCVFKSLHAILFGKLGLSSFIVINAGLSFNT